MAQGIGLALLYYPTTSTYLLFRHLLDGDEISADINRNTHMIVATALTVLSHTSFTSTTPRSRAWFLP